VYLERTNASAETVNRATEIRLLPERQMGEFLKVMPRNDGGPPAKTGAAPEPISELTLAEIRHHEEANQPCVRARRHPRDGVQRARGGR